MHTPDWREEELEERTDEGEMKNPYLYGCNITLRDLFAAATLCGIAANKGHGVGMSRKRKADSAYKMADQMLKERSK